MASEHLEAGAAMMEASRRLSEYIDKQKHISKLVS